MRAEKEDPEFIKVPWAVCRRLIKARATGAAWVLACHLYLLKFKAWGKDQPLVVSNTGLQKYHLSAYKKRRALLELETLGLISIEQIPGKCPRVKLTV